MGRKFMAGAAALALGLGAWTMSQAGDDLAAKDAQRIGELIKRLGSTKYIDRESAKKELEAIGSPALEALRKASSGEDLETSKRATELVRKLEERVLTANLLAPKMVRLKVKDATVLDAVNELSKQSGYPINVNGDRAVLADRKVTLDTGDVSFWEALDQLCAKAGLNEQINATTQPGQPGINPIRPGRIVRPPLRVLPVQPIQPLPAPAQPDAAPAQPNAAPAQRPALQVRAIAEVEVAQIQVQAQPAQVQAAQPAKVQVQPAKAQAQPAKADPAAQDVPVQAQPAQALPIQIQVQPIQIQPIQIQPGGIGIGRIPQPGMPATGINLQPGTDKQPTSYAGAVRVRLVKSPTQKAGQYTIVLDVAAEPRMNGFKLVGNPTLDRAVDQHGQELKLAVNMPQGADPRANPNLPPNILPAMDIAVFNPFQATQRQATMNLQAGDKQAKNLKELTGSLTGQVMVADALISVDDVMKAAGKTAQGKAGGALTINSIEKKDNGEYHVAMRLENMPGQNPFGGMINGAGVIQIQQAQIQINGGNVVIGGGPVGANNGLPELTDAKGNKFQMVNVPNRRMNFNNGQMSQEITVVYRAPAGAGEPARMVVNGQRSVNFNIPFAFRNVDLP